MILLSSPWRLNGMSSYASAAACPDASAAACPDASAASGGSGGSGGRARSQRRNSLEERYYSQSPIVLSWHDHFAPVRATMTVLHLSVDRDIDVPIHRQVREGLRRAILE